MSHEQRVCLVPSLRGFRASPQSYYGTAAIGTGAGSGPPGSNSMLFWSLFNTRRKPAGATTDVIFTRGRTAVGGWLMQTTNTSGGTLIAQVHNAAFATIQLVVPSYVNLEGFDVPYLAMFSYQDGVLTGWMNGISAGTAGVAGVGYGVYARPTVIGANNWTASGYCIDTAVSDCGMLQGYDVTTYVDPVFGNSAPGLARRWLADLREGRYLTWPRAAVANSDWYWAAADVVRELATLPTWTDRYTADVMTKFGQPQPGCFPARPI